MSEIEDHETRLLREFPERVEYETWITRFWALTGDRWAAQDAFEYAERSRGSLTLTESLEATARALALGWLRITPREQIPCMVMTPGGFCLGYRGHVGGHTA